ncbi:hypothetical protein C9884_29195, partial [Klebsiella pneumoniae]
LFGGWRSVGSDVEEAARTVGATPLQVMTSVSLPISISLRRLAQRRLRRGRGGAHRRRHAAAGDDLGESA